MRSEEAARRRSRWSLCGGSFQKPFERGKPTRPAGSRTFCPPKKSHAKNAKSAKKWKEVGEPGCVSPRNNNKMIAVTLCLKRAYPNDETETFLGWTPPSESFLTALPSRKCGSLQKSLSQPKPLRPAGSRLCQPLNSFLFCEFKKVFPFTLCVNCRSIRQVL